MKSKRASRKDAIEIKLKDQHDAIVWLVHEVRSLQRALKAFQEKEVEEPEYPEE